MMVFVFYIRVSGVATCRKKRKRIKKFMNDGAMAGS